MKFFLVFSSIVVISSAIQCWQGQETVSNGRRLDPEIGGPFISVQCANADFCFNSYVLRHKNQDNSYTETKSCGEVGKCFDVGCRGSIDEKICCCAGDLCNSSNGLNFSVAGILIILSLFFIYRI